MKPTTIMNTQRSRPNFGSMLIATTVAAAPLLNAESIVVDWFEFAQGSGPSTFELKDDAGIAAAEGLLVLEPNKGQSFPGFPKGGMMSGDSWLAPLEIEDSQSGNEDVLSFGVRVVPETGVVSYQVNFSLLDGSELLLAIGGLYRDSTGSTQTVQISAQSGANPRDVTLINQVGWDNGVTQLIQAVGWTPADNTISTLPASDGDSEFSFFVISPRSGGPATLSLDVPHGYPLGSGDEITIALGRVIPESGTAILTCIGGFLMVSRRRRFSR